MTAQFVDVHVVQSVPPSNINRDDTGSPKQARYGGVDRARVSSQSWKRATRKHFWEGIDSAEASTRTKRVVGTVANRLVVRTGIDRADAVRIATHLTADLKLTNDKKEKSKKGATDDVADPESSYLLFFGRTQVDALIDEVADRAVELAALDEEALKSELVGVSAVRHLSSGHPLDVALFGRMVADLASLGVDAAAQVAHAISTHAVQTEFDYFTAVDDEKAAREDEDAGAGMIGTIEFNSATLYRYATVSIEGLTENLGGSLEDAADGIARFIDGFARSMPTGKSNTFANRTLPTLVLVVLRSDQPVNLVSAFEQPVRASADSGLVQKSVERLGSEFEQIGEQWGVPPIRVLANYSSAVAGAVPASFGPNFAFPALVDAVRQAVAGSGK